MKCYDEQLRQLQAQCARKKKLEASLEELRAQRKTYAARTEELRQLLSDEQADVDRLEGRSLAALQGCEARYASVLQEKTLAVKAAGGSTAEKLLELEERQGYLMSQKQELQEAWDAGRAALSCADQILSQLDSAESWGTWDLLGGGLVSDLMKHSRLDDAQAAVETLQTRLRRFKTELADVTIDANIQVSIDGFLRVADYFFDGIFADWAVLDRIHQSQQQVQHTRSQISGVLAHLRTLMDQAETELLRISEETEQLVRSVSM